MGFDNWNDFMFYFNSKLVMLHDDFFPLEIIPENPHQAINEPEPKDSDLSKPKM